MESDYLPGMESWLDDLHCRADFSYVLGSVHPQTDEYRAMYLEGANRLEYEKSYFENLANAAESGLFDCLSHPDIVKIVHPSQYNVGDHLGYDPPRPRPHRPRRHGHGAKHQRSCTNPIAK